MLVCGVHYDTAWHGRCCTLALCSSPFRAAVSAPCAPARAPFPLPVPFRPGCPFLELPPAPSLPQAPLPASLDGVTWLLAQANTPLTLMAVGITAPAIGPAVLQQVGTHTLVCRWAVGA